MYGAYLSYRQTKYLLSILEQNKLIERRGRVYKITRKGRQYMQKFKELDRMIPLDVKKGPAASAGVKH